MSLVDRADLEPGEPLSAADVKTAVLDAWTDVLGTPDPAPDDNFFDGGDSLGAVELVARLEESLSVTIAMRDFLADPTVAGVTRLCTRTSPAAAGGAEPLVTLETRGSEPPLFCFHAAAGTVTRFIPLVRGLPEPRQALGLQARGADSESPERYASFEEMVQSYEAAVRRAATGPHLLLGYSLGGLLAYEVARRLRRDGHEVAFVGLLDTRSEAGETSTLAERLEWFVRQGLQLDMDIDELAAVPDPDERVARIRDAALAAGAIDPSVSARRVANMADMYESNVRLVSSYRPGRYDGLVTLFRASDPDDDEPHELGWASHASQLDVVDVPGDHFTMMRPPHVRVLARAVSAALAAALATASPVTQSKEEGTTQ